MDNNELALALREQDLDKVAVYLSRCGQATNHDLVSLGYPDIGWDPVEGERFLDFLRFCVWVNGTCICLRHTFMLQVLYQLGKSNCKFVLYQGFILGFYLFQVRVWKRMRT